MLFSRVELPENEKWRWVPGDYEIGNEEGTRARDDNMKELKRRREPASEEIL